MTILAIDQGTTGTTTALFDKDGKIVTKAYREFTQIYPQPGWVEHDPLEIWQTVVATVEEVCQKRSGPITAAGITNQRETTVIWDRKTGNPIYNAIVWQCRRTADWCSQRQNRAEWFRSKTGLPLDPYFSGTKIRWILENASIKKGADLLFGTIDTWLIWKLTGGRVHATDFTNASRTLLFNITSKKWDMGLCKKLSVPTSMLPEVKKTIDHYGEITAVKALRGTPILGVAGDQQASLFGQTCFSSGEMKNTYGTGCFVVMNMGHKKRLSQKGLITTLAIDEKGNPCYALEGSIFIAGAAIQWLRDELRIIMDAKKTEKAALSVDTNNGVYLVPAFVGLGAPHWDADARGAIVGLTRGANRNHIIRAALEAIAFQTRDVLDAMRGDTGLKPCELYVDGGATANNFLMQFQADILNIPVIRPTITESTSLGAAYLAGLHAGVWKNTESLRALKSLEKKFTPVMDAKTRNGLLKGWKKALRQAKKR
jgi:glycerol kinase